MGHPDDSRSADVVLIGRIAPYRLLVQLDCHPEGIWRRRNSGRDRARFPVDRAGPSHADNLTAQNLRGTKQTNLDTFTRADSLGVRFVKGGLDGHTTRVENLQRYRSGTDRAAGNQSGRPNNAADRRQQLNAFDGWRDTDLHFRVGGSVR